MVKNRKPRVVDKYGKPIDQSIADYIHFKEGKDGWKKKLPPMPEPSVNEKYPPMPSEDRMAEVHEEDEKRRWQERISAPESDIEKKAPDKKPVMKPEKKPERQKLKYVNEQERTKNFNKEGRSGEVKQKYRKPRTALYNE